MRVTTTAASVVEIASRCYITNMKSFFARKYLLNVLRIIIALLLFGQFTLLAQACTAQAAGPIVGQLGAHGSMPCCKHMSANACLTQLTHSDEAPTGSHVAMLPDATVMAGITIVPVEHTGPALPARQIAALDLHEPPPSIRFCSFQT